MNAVAIVVLVIGLGLITAGTVILLRDQDYPSRSLRMRALAAAMVLAGTGIALMPLLFVTGVE